MKIMKIDATIPDVSLEGLLDEIMVGDSYALPTSYTVNEKLSGGSVKCIDEEKNVIEDTKTLGIGEHTITCTVTTGAGNTAEISKTIKVTEQKYKTGDPYELGGYKWHVISDDGINLTLLMDANQLGDNSNMAHCTDDTKSSTDCGIDNSTYQYSWNKSKIYKYLNTTFYNDLRNKITNTIVSTSVCADPSKTGQGVTYGGYLRSELFSMNKLSDCSKYVSSNIRLISRLEYYNMDPNLANNSNLYPNVNGIKRLDETSDYALWFNCYSSSCGDSYGAWWGMTSYVAFDNGGQKVLQLPGTSYFFDSAKEHGVRPVITIVK